MREGAKDPALEEPVRAQDGCGERGWASPRQNGTALQVEVCMWPSGGRLDSQREAAYLRIPQGLQAGEL